MDRTGVKLCALAHKRCSTSLRLKSFSQSGSGAVITTAALHHLHVLGPTGTGKSTLLINLIRQDMQAGKAVVVVDPQGDLVTDVLTRIPAHRDEDVIVLDPADTSVPVGLNPLLTRGRNPEIVADGLLGVMIGAGCGWWQAVIPQANGEQV